MQVIRFDRFTIDPADTEQLLAHRRALITAVRESLPGLVETVLTRIGEKTWVDMWRWESMAHAQAAVARAQSGGFPQAPAAFALTHAHTTEFAEVVAER